MKRAIFFDLDGTLWDALTPVTESYNIAMIKNNEPYRYSENTIRSLMGLTPVESCSILFPNKTLEDGLRLFNICYQEELDYLSKCPGRLYEGVESTLEELKTKYPLYIVSNADKGYIENFLDSLNMHSYFKGFLQAGDTHKDKWENILLLKEKENIDEVIYVGDTLKDYIEATKANCKFIHATYGFGIINDEVNKIDSFNELISVVSNLFKD